MTTKELTALQEHLTEEQVITKKYRTMAKQCSDPAISQRLEAIASQHQRHFETLMSHLKG
jgi:rubrerythrin